MKKAVTVSLVAITLFFSACKSPEANADKARENVEDAKADLKTAQNEADSAIIKADNEKEWIAFKTESDMKIKNTEDQIALLKEKLKKEDKAMNLKYNNRIDSLEVKSRELKNRINSYSNNQTNWQAFKSEFNNDMEGLGKALKNFVVPVKK